MSETDAGRGYYEQNYRNYTLQNPPRKMGFYRSLAHSCRPEKPQPKILDLGCAFGSFLSSLDDSWDRFGLDINEYAISKASESMPGVQLAVSSAETIPFDTVFDVVVSFDCLEHVPDLEQVAQTVSDRLEEGGHFVFVVPVYDGPLGWLVRLLDHDLTHIHKEPRSFWLDWAASHFDVQEWLGIFRYLTPTGYYVHQPTRPFRAIAPAVAIVARKR